MFENLNLKNKLKLGKKLNEKIMFYSLSQFFCLDTLTDSVIEFRKKYVLHKFLNQGKR